MNDYFKIRLKSLRKKNLKTQEDMAKYLGLSRSTYAEYERGRITPPLETVEVISKYFNVSVDYLMGTTNFENHDEMVEAPKDITDIAKQLNVMVGYLKDDKYALKFNGSDLSNESREFLLNNLENSLKMIEKVNSK